MPEARIEPGRVDVDAELGIEEHPAGIVRSKDDQRQQPDKQEPAAARHRVLAEARSPGPAARRARMRGGNVVRILPAAGGPVEVLQ